MKCYKVYMEVTVRKMVLCECETEEEAWNSPWDYAIDEHELDTIDQEITRVEEIPDDSEDA